MGLFGKKKKEENKTPACACNCGCPAQEATEIKGKSQCCGEAVDGICCIKVLGVGCASCHQQYEYAKEAVRKYGTAKGMAMAAKRFVKCNPFAKGGFDAVKINYKGKAKWVL